MKSPCSLFCVALFLAPVSAQKIPVNEAAGRIVQIVDAHALITSENGAAVMPEEAARRLRELAAFARDFVEPPLKPGDDVQALGDRYLAVLAQADQAAWVERLVATAVRSADQMIEVAIQLVELPNAAALEHLLPLFGKTKEIAGQATPAAPLRKVLESADAIVKVLGVLQNAKEASTVHAPRLTVRPLSSGMLSAGEKISYIRDFEIETTKNGPIADPVVDTVFDGIRVQVTVARLEREQLAVQCEVLMQTVTKPIPSFTTTLTPGTPITIQLPRSTAVRMQQKAILPDGGGVLLAARKSDGSYLCAILGARTSK